MPPQPSDTDPISGAAQPSIEASATSTQLDADPWWRDLAELGTYAVKVLAMFVAGVPVVAFVSWVLSFPLAWVWKVTSWPRSYVVGVIDELGLLWSLVVVAVSLIALVVIVRTPVGVALYIRAYGRPRATRALARLSKRQNGDPALAVASRLLQHQVRPGILLLCVLLSAVLGLSAWLQDATIAVQLSLAAVPLLVGLRPLWPLMPYVARLVVGPLVGMLIGFFWLGARDVLFLGGALLLFIGSLLLIERLKRPTWWAIGAATLSLGGPWYGWSAFERASLSFTTRADATAAPPSSPLFGVALSGGGFRAALFHAGVLSELKSRGLVPAALSAVSGGAIFGSYYSTGGSPEAFVEGVTRGQFNIGREALTVYSLPRLLLATNVPKANVQLWPIAFSRTQMLAEQLDRAFLQGRPLEATRPPLLVGLSDARKGTAVGIWPGGALELPIHTLADRRASDDNACPPPMQDPGDLNTLVQGPLSRLVATSASFPLAFPGISTETRHLVDGGIVDNTGAGLFVCAREASNQSTDANMRAFGVDQLIISDGGAVASSEASTVDWIETLHRATGPFSVSPQSAFRRLPIAVVSAAELIDEWRAYGTGKYKELPQVERRIVVRLYEHIYEMLDACLQGACRDGWTLGKTEFDSMATFMDRA